jgi:FtsP/CotA-like multicopper oxidase with cupredoxin domain
VTDAVDNEANTRTRSRRDFLRLTWTLAAGAALPPALYGCMDSGSDAAPLPVETFREPQVLSAVDGRLDVTLKLAYLETTLHGKRVNLRNMYGTIPAPTLRVNAGDTLRILVVNELPPNPPSTEPVTHLRYPNSTNLHTHGLHVTPGLVSPGVYGDYVMDDPTLGVQPGQSRQHEYAIGRDHPAGAYWYHPHLHGSTAIQLGSGMAGALLVKGEIDKVPEIAAAFERVFVFQAPAYDESGTIESFSHVTDDPVNESDFLINGVHRPRILMRRGEVQNWHLVNASIFKFVNLALDGHALHLYSFDGNTRRGLKPIGPVTPDEATVPDGLVLATGNRASVLVQAGAPGTYLLRSLEFLHGFGPTPEQILAEVVVIDDPLPMRLPAGPLPVPAALAPITDAEFARGGGMKRSIVLAALFNPYPDDAPRPPITDPPLNAIVHPGDELADWVYQTDNTFMADGIYAIGSPGGLASPNPGMPAEYIPFQSRRALRQLVALGSVEEWTVYNVNNVRHPFHIHVNPFYVIKVNGELVEPYWADTIALPRRGSLAAPTSITFRTRFQDFKGAYVMHCHMAAHEDMGMMQVVEVV